MSQINPLHDEIAQLRRQNEDLKAEVADLRDKLYGQKVEEEVARIKAAFKIPRAMAYLLRALSDGGVKSQERLLECYIHNDNREVDPKNVDVYMARIRKQFGKDVIITHWRFGRSMSPEFCEKVKAVMARGQQ